MYICKVLFLFLKIQLCHYIKTCVCGHEPRQALLAFVQIRLILNTELAN